MNPKTEARTPGAAHLELPAPYPKLLPETIPPGNLPETDRVKRHLDALKPLNQPWNRIKWLSWVDRIDPEHERGIAEQVNEKSRPVYFSAEYGLPGMGFNGGLGVLSGDHYLQALYNQQPGVFIGLGYDTRKKQVVRHNDKPDFWQDEETVAIPSPRELGFEKADNLSVILNIKGATEHLEVNRYGIGNGATALYRIEAGGEVYPGSQHSDDRLRHDVALGIGGYQVVKQLQAQGVIGEPPLYHLNESATVLGAVALLDDRTQQNMDAGQNPDEALRNALDYVAAKSLLTNHTLVPAASSTFNQGQCDAFIFSNLHNDKAKGWLQQFINNHGHNLPLGDLALHLAGRYNGVSKLHARVATESFSKAYGMQFGRPMDIEPVTNGVFAQRWNPEAFDALQEAGIVDKFGLPEQNTGLFNQKIEEMPAGKMAAIKKEAVDRFRQYLAEGNKLDQFGEKVELPENAVIIGEARRFAGYKRRWMSFQDPDKLRRILTENPRAHIVLAGKAHPNDDIAKPQVAWVMNKIKEDPLFRERIHFIVDYDVELAQHLESAAHVWVNTPEVGEEACGTSGMKVGLMGTHVSTRDGFYAEMDRDSYYAIEGPTNSAQEFNSYYEQLGKAVKDASRPSVWAQKVKESWKGGLLDIAMGARMLQDYALMQFPSQAPGEEAAMPVPEPAYA